MTRKHLYFHSSNLEYTRELREDPHFEHSWELDPISRNKSFPYEYGRIKTNQNYIHIMIGRIPQKSCPWCGTEPFVNKIMDSDGFSCSQYCMQCPKCGSRGPIMYLSRAIEQDKSAQQEFLDFMKTRYTQRLPWDHDFKNPHDELGSEK